MGACISHDPFNKIPWTGPHIAVDSPDVFPQQTHGQELCADKNKQNGKEGKHPCRGPLGAINQSHEKQKEPESHAECGNNAAHNIQQAEGEGGHAGQQVKLQVNEFPEAVLGIPGGPFGMLNIHP